MCGITGIVSLHPIAERQTLAAMRDSMQHRGPDDAGEWWSADGCVGLAHRRLSIIDLSPAGHQPMPDHTGRYCIVFNGEIYNYRELKAELETLGHMFRSTSDTEVLLEAYRKWGTECLARLEGMFAFAIYDSSERKLFVARDRAGEKPLFYWQSTEGFHFASELKGLLAHPKCPRTISLRALEFYLTYGYVPGELCILNGVKKLPPAHAICFDTNLATLKIWRYWRLPEAAPHDVATADELTAELESLLRNSVKRRLIADVPVGILLSGGVDSSLVTAVAAQVSSHPVRTFSVSFPGSGTYDEGPYAKIVANHFGTQHTELVAESASVDLLPKLARQFDEPMCDSSMVPTYLLSKLIRQNATVALGGDGGDELFGGYVSYSWVFQQERIRNWVPSVIRSIASSAGSALPIGFKGRNFFRGISGNLNSALSQANTFFDPRTRRNLIIPLRDQERNGASPELFKSELCEEQRGLPGKAMALDFQTYLPEDILVKIDRASMLASLELRAPFLDHHIIEFAFRNVPNGLRANAKERKILLRSLGKKLLPPALDLRRKQGFSVPMNTWMKGTWGSFIQNVLRESDSSLFNGNMIDTLIYWQRHGCNNGERLFALALFELWRREYKIGTHCC